MRSHTQDPTGAHKGLLAAATILCCLQLAGQLEQWQHHIAGQHTCGWPMSGSPVPSEIPMHHALLVQARQAASHLCCCCQYSSQAGRARALGHEPAHEDGICQCAMAAPLPHQPGLTPGLACTQHAGLSTSPTQQSAVACLFNAHRDSALLAEIGAMSICAHHQ